MPENDSTFLRDFLIRQEGILFQPTPDPASTPQNPIMNIGVGRNLTQLGLSQAEEMALLQRAINRGQPDRDIMKDGITNDEAMLLLDNDIARSFQEAKNIFPNFNSLTAARQDAIAGLLFNLGVNRFKKFDNMIQAIKKGDFDQAAIELNDSKRTRETQVPLSRSREETFLLKEGRFPTRDEIKGFSN